ncbi:NADAR family protein [Nonomuraea sp. NPDC049400]|uniref:NADAR family protein n=1 Tax=Nonomuraea sp. NPDC049400 TaxID=3364352 RepID=UPI0037AF86EA
MQQGTSQNLMHQTGRRPGPITSTPAVIDNFRGRYEFLSNFFEKIPVTLPTREGIIEFPSLEHAFNWAKSLDARQRAWVLAADTPREAKRRGRAVQLRPDWNNFTRFLAMDTALRAKFAPGSRLANLLLATGDAFLIEGNRWHDNEWGDCRCGQLKCQQPGFNWLGKMLMSLRYELRFPDVPITPLSVMTGVPGLCRIQSAAVPDELVAAVTRQPDLVAMLGAEPRVVLARVLELVYPKSAAERAANPPASPPTANLAEQLGLPRPATPGSHIPGPNPRLDPRPDPDNPHQAWSRLAVLWSTEKAQAPGAHPYAAGADLKAAVGASA